MATLALLCDLLDQLRMLLGADEQPIRRIHDDETAYTRCCDAPTGCAVDQGIIGLRMQAFAVALGGGALGEARVIAGGNIEAGAAQSYDDVACRIRRVEGSDLAPATNIVPPHGDGDNRDIASMLHHPHVNRDIVAQAWPDRAHYRAHLICHAALGATCGGADLIERFADDRHLLADLFQNAIYPPDKDARVPDVVACAQVLLGDLPRRFLDELLDGIGLSH